MIIVLIIYLLFVLYKHVYTQPLTRDDISQSIESVDEHFTNNNLVMTIGISSNNTTSDKSEWEKKQNIEIRLFDDELPITTKNFRQIAKNGINGKKYNNSIFHRIIPNFMIQGGDILNNNGTGSISIYGEKFDDEGFSLKHDKPGLLSMANSGPNTNGSQFFITTVSTPHLDNKHVVFGEVVKGFEYIKEIEKIETDSNDKPYNRVEIVDIREV
tara:strand:+ start:962 stop:1603 length:642 start_codon:yes stop_codon:yes gene_type:complete